MAAASVHMDVMAAAPGAAPKAPGASTSGAIDGKTYAKTVMENGLCNCFDDIETCLCGWLTPCAAIGVNMERAKLGSCFNWGCIWTVLTCIIPGAYACVGGSARGTLQTALGIIPNCCGNCCLHCCCTACAMAQEGRAAKAMAGIPMGTCVLAGDTGAGAGAGAAAAGGASTNYASAPAAAPTTATTNSRIISASAFTVISLAFVFFLAALGDKTWFDGQGTQHGLWKLCSGSVCNDIEGPDCKWGAFKLSHCGDIQGTRATVIIAIACSAAAIAGLMATEYKGINKMLGGVFAIIAGVFGLIAMGIWIGYHDYLTTKYDYGAAFNLDIVAWLFSFGGGVAVMVVRPFKIGLPGAPAAAGA